jgi:hypothetical protein
MPVILESFKRQLCHALCTLNDAVTHTRGAAEQMIGIETRGYDLGFHEGFVLTLFVQ